MEGWKKYSPPSVVTKWLRVTVVGSALVWKGHLMAPDAAWDMTGSRPSPC